MPHTRRSKLEDEILQDIDDDANTIIIISHIGGGDGASTVRS